jgi:hypothetical protein
MRDRTKILLTILCNTAMYVINEVKNNLDKVYEDIESYDEANVAEDMEVEQAEETKQ